MTAYAQESTYIPRRLVVFALIVVLHGVLVWALASGLARKVVEVIAPPIQTDIIEEIQQDDKPPPPPPPEMERPPVEVPPPEVNISIPVEASTTAITNVTDRPVPMAAPPPPPVAVNRVPPKPDMRRSEGSDAYYPPASKRAEEEGVVTVRVCVDEKGRVTGTPTVQKGSGYERLDEGAVKYVSRGMKFTPGTENGKPVEACFAFNVRFQLTN